MSTAHKYTLTRIVSLGTILVFIVLSGQLYQAGINGDTGTAKLYFALIVAVFMVAIPCTIAAYYYKVLPDDGAGQDSKIAIEILAAAGRRNLPQENTGDKQPADTNAQTNKHTPRTAH